MTNNAVRFALGFVVLLFAQVLILNQISVFGYAVPFLYIYLIIKLPLDANRIVVMLTAFFLGLLVDVFTHTLGLHAGASVLAAVLRPYVQQLFLSQEDFSEAVPSMAGLGAWKFYKYAVLMVLIHHTAVFLLEYLSLSQPLYLLMHIGASSLLTLLLVFPLERFSSNRSAR